MRASFILIALFFISMAIFAQPVVESTSFTNANTVLFLETPSPIWLAEQTLTSQSGENQDWNINEWQALQETVQSHYPLDEVPIAYQLFFNTEFLYPEHVSTHGLIANLDSEQNPLPIQVEDPFAFFRTDETGYYSTGTAFTIEGIPVVTQNDSIERIFEFPLEYGGTDTTFISYLTEVPLLGVFGQSGSRVSEVDGWGVLNTPYGSYDVLRIRSEISLTDTVFVEQLGTGEIIERPVEVEYNWISPEVPGPVLTINVVENTAISASLYAEDGILNTANSLSKSSFPLFYPNPASDEIRLNPDLHIASVIVIDYSGREVVRQLQPASTLNVDFLPSGVYLIIVQTENNEILHKKLIIE